MKKVSGQAPVDRAFNDPLLEILSERSFDEHWPDICVAIWSREAPHPTSIRSKTNAVGRASDGLMRSSAATLVPGHGRRAQGSRIQAAASERLEPLAD
jgi:hypothetical protein